MNNWLLEILKIILDRSVINTAIGLSLAASFTLFIGVLTKSILVPLVGLIFGKYNLANWKVSVKGNDFQFGLIISSILTVIMAAVILYYLIIIPINKLNNKLGIKTLSQKTCPYCTTSISKEATVCPACTRDLN